MNPRRYVLLALATLPCTFQDSLSNGAVREVLVAHPRGTTVEFFRLDLVGDSGAAATTPAGTVRWVSGPDGTVPGAWRTEIEVSFFAECTRVLLTERVQPKERELVFRELRARSGRTLRFLWTPDQRGVSTETTGGELRRTEFDMRRSAALPLSLVEVARRGGALGGSVHVFQPLTNELEPLDVRLDAAEHGRVLELRRGSLLAGSYRFDGDRLMGFRWQDGGLEARPIEAKAYAAMLANARPSADDSPAARSRQPSSLTDSRPESLRSFRGRTLTKGPERF